MRFYRLLLGSLSIFLFSSPAEAGRLLSWRFESSQNQLFLTTEEEIQPRAQLISNPNRVVIDLPGTTLDRSSVKQAVGGYVSSLRVGQFDAQTTRLVIELAPEYTFDPQQVRIKALSPTQWTVHLPTPQPLTQTLPLPPTPSETSRHATQPPSSFTTPSITTSKQSQSTTDFQITRNGLFIRLNSNGDNSKIKVQRSRDRKTIEFTLEDATLPSSLVSQSLPVNSYGIRDIQFAQTSSDTKITLNVALDSPDWQAIYSRFGGLVLLPKGGVSSLEGSNRISQLPLEEKNNESDFNIRVVGK